MARASLVEEGLRLVNAGASLSAWARSVTVAEVDALAEQLGVARRPTKAATVDAIRRAPRPAVIEEGLRRARSGRGIRSWFGRARATEVRATLEQLELQPGATKRSGLQLLLGYRDRRRRLRRQARTLQDHMVESERLAVEAFDDLRLFLFARILAARSPRRAVRIREVFAAVQAYVDRAVRRLDRELHARAQVAARMAARDVVAQLGVPRRRALRRAADAVVAQARHRPFVRRLLMEIQADLQRFAGATMDRQRLARLLAGGGLSRLRRMVHRVRLMSRMTAIQAYNDAVLAAAESVQGARIVKRIDEILDARNHPFSRAADGITAPLGRPFRVPVARVRAEAVALRRGAGGVLWRRDRGAFVGQSLPAHFNDRGRIVLQVVPS